MPQVEYNNFCNNNFFATLQIKPQKIPKEKTIRYMKECSQNVPNTNI